MSRPTTFIFVSVLLAARSLAATYPIPLASRSSVVSCSSSAPGRYHYSLSVPTAADCLAACGGLASDATAVLRRDGRGEYNCFCLQEDDLDALDDSQCAADSWYAYTALPEATTSEPAEDGLEAPKYATPDKAGGRLVIQNKRGRERHIGLCEAGYKPCKVLGHDATYKVSHSIIEVEEGLRPVRGHADVSDGVRSVRGGRVCHWWGQCYIARLRVSRLTFFPTP